MMAPSLRVVHNADTMGADRGTLRSVLGGEDRGMRLWTRATRLAGMGGLGR